MPFQDLHPLGGIEYAAYLHAEGEAVQELRTQVAFLGVHGAHEDEAGRVGEADPLPLDDVHPHGRRIEQQVHDVVIEQVDLVHVQQPAVGGGEDARLEVALSLLDGQLDVQRAHDAILSGADGKVHEASATARQGQDFALLPPLLTVVAHRFNPVRGTVEGAIGHHFDLGKQRGQGAGSGGLGRAPLAADEHAADATVDGVEDQSTLHALLTDDGGERIQDSHREYRTPDSKGRQSPDGFIGYIGLIGYIGFIGSIGSIGFIGFIGSIGSIGFIGSIGSIG